MKYDVKKAFRQLYAPSAADFALVDVPTFRYIAVDGRGDPNTSPAYAAAVESLYGTAYVLKFAAKDLGQDFVVAPLEGLWRSADPSTFVSRQKDTWEWTMMISQPDWVTDDMIRALARGDVRPFTLTEGSCTQILHVGSYDDEGPTLARLHHEYLPAHGLTFNGDHHEIYLSDARRTAPERLRTILRQPVR